MEKDICSRCEKHMTSEKTVIKNRIKYNCKCGHTKVIDGGNVFWQDPVGDLDRNKEVIKTFTSEETKEIDNRIRKRYLRKIGRGWSYEETT